MSLTVATSSSSRQSPASPGARPHRGAELAALAHALPHALAPDRERPARWLSTPFVVTVEQTRHRLAPIDDVDSLAEAFDRLPLREQELAASFADAIAALARDAHRIAGAIRRLEITDGTPLASWPELVRGGLARSTHSRSDNDASLWFG